MVNVGVIGLSPESVFGNNEARYAAADGAADVGEVSSTVDVCSTRWAVLVLCDGFWTSASGLKRRGADVLPDGGNVISCIWAFVAEDDGGASRREARTAELRETGRGVSKTLGVPSFNLRWTAGLAGSLEDGPGLLVDRVDGAFVELAGAVTEVFPTPAGARITVCERSAGNAGAALVGTAGGGISRLWATVFEVFAKFEGTCVAFLAETVGRADAVWDEWGSVVDEPEGSADMAGAADEIFAMTGGTVDASSLKRYSCVASRLIVEQDAFVAEEEAAWAWAIGGRTAESAAALDSEVKGGRTKGADRDRELWAGLEDEFTTLSDTSWTDSER
jgi:hypothetical protein